MFFRGFSNQTTFTSVIRRIFEISEMTTTTNETIAPVTFDRFRVRLPPNGIVEILNKRWFDVTDASQEVNQAVL